MCFLAQCKCGVNKIRSRNRIVDGTDANPGEFPWQALIRIDMRKGENITPAKYTLRLVELSH